MFLYRTNLNANTANRRIKRIIFVFIRDENSGSFFNMVGSKILYRTNTSKFVIARRALSLAPPARAGVPTKQSLIVREIASGGYALAMTDVR
jgi:hypothetical protein